MTLFEMPLDMDYLVIHLMHEIQTAEGKVWWRECVQTNGMAPDEVGYMVVWPDGNHLHTYRYPPDWI